MQTAVLVVMILEFYSKRNNVVKLHGNLLRLQKATSLAGKKYLYHAIYYINYNTDVALV